MGHRSSKPALCCVQGRRAVRFTAVASRFERQSGVRSHGCCPNLKKTPGAWSQAPSEFLSKARSCRGSFAWWVAELTSFERRTWSRTSWMTGSGKGYEGRRIDYPLGTPVGSYLRSLNLCWLILHDLLCPLKNPALSKKREQRWMLVQRSKARAACFLQPNEPKHDLCLGGWWSRAVVGR